jgi:hypothetical protein
LHVVNLTLQSNLAAHQTVFSNELAASQARRDAAAAALAKIEAAPQSNSRAAALEVGRLDKEGRRRAALRAAPPPPAIATPLHIRPQNRRAVGSKHRFFSFYLAALCLNIFHSPASVNEIGGET